MDANRISIMGVQIYVKCLIYSTATPLDVINAFDLLMTQTRDEANIDKVKLLRCIYHSEQQDRKNIKIVKSDLTLPKEVCLNHALVSLLRLSYYYHKCFPVPELGIHNYSNIVKN